MWPWGHLLFGYLVYTVGTHAWNRRSPGGGNTLVLGLGTQLPDLVDKPANWYFDIGDGRAMGHSLFTTIPLCLGIYLVARRYGREDVGVAFAVGLVSHLVSDVLVVVVKRLGVTAPYLFWPLVPAPTYPSDSFRDQFVRLQSQAGSLDATSVLELLGGAVGLYVAFLVGVFVVWVVDGLPGSRALWQAFVILSAKNSLG